MNKKIIFGVAAAVIFIGVAIYAIAVWEPSSPATEDSGASLSGTVSYRERVDLPAGSLIEVQIRDVSRDDAPAEILAETSVVTQGESAPIPFIINYRSDGIQTDRLYSVFARIFVGHELKWVTDSAISFIENGSPIKNVNLVLSMTGSSGEGMIKPIDLEGKTFRIVSFDGTEVPEGSQYTLEFREGTVYAKICNSMFGGFILENGKIEGTLASTLKFCTEPLGIMDAEDTVNNLFNVGASASFVDGTLTLSGDSGTVILTQVQ